MDINTIIKTINQSIIFKDIRIELVLNGPIKEKLKKILPFWMYTIIKVGEKNTLLITFIKNIHLYIPMFLIAVETRVINKISKNISKYINIYREISLNIPSISIHFLIKPLLIKIWNVDNILNSIINKRMLEIGTDLIIEHFNADTFINLKDPIRISIIIKKKSYGGYLTTLARESIIDKVMKNGIQGLETFIQYGEYGCMEKTFYDNDISKKFGRWKGGYIVTNVNILNSIKSDDDTKYLLSYISITKSLLKTTNNFFGILNFMIENNMFSDYDHDYIKKR